MKNILWIVVVSAFLITNAYPGEFIAIAKKTGDDNAFYKSTGPDKKTASKNALEKCYKEFIYVMDENGKMLSKKKAIKYAKKNKWCYVDAVVEQ
jgi:molecular chaperone GrpE (heat shock protein)